MRRVTRAPALAAELFQEVLPRARTLGGLSYFTVALGWCVATAQAAALCTRGEHADALPLRLSQCDRFYGPENRQILPQHARILLPYQAKRFMSGAFSEETSS